ncbi:MAG TPA: lipid-binding SYLF domain-containing protein [Vicinamibacteria bacterium]|nr:lipid-binding SYLF domain-containing protein [Vicinamibacteria bacterium]
MTARRHPRTLYLAVLALASGPAAVSPQEREERRLEACRSVLEEVAGVKEGIPRDLLDRAECVAVVPGVKKAALGVGGRYGKGAAVCRIQGGHGPWGPPLLITVGGPSVGFQIGGQSADHVFLVMNPKGIDHLLKSRFTLGGDVSVAAGPVGRAAEAATDLRMEAEILSYSRAKGLFAGASLEGSVVRPDKDGNRRLYGTAVDPRDVLIRSRRTVPEAARPLVALLDRLSARGDEGW